MPSPKKKTVAKKPKAPVEAAAPEEAEVPVEADAAPAPEAEAPVETEVTSRKEGKVAAAKKKGDATKAHARLSAGSNIIRTYTLEEHGEDFASLAEEFAGHQGLIVELE